MSYIEIDLATPRMGKYCANGKSKYLLTESVAKGGINTGKWPTKWVNGFEVFDKLPLGNRYVGAINHKQVYKGLGIRVGDIAKNDMSQLEDLWMYLKPKPFGRPTVTAQDVIDFLEDDTTIGEEIIVDLVFTKKITTQNVREHLDIVDQDIIGMVEGGYESVYPITTTENTTKVVNGRSQEVSHKVFTSFVEYDTPGNTTYADENGDSTPVERNKASKSTFASLMDTDDALYDSETTLISKVITPAYSTSWSGTQNITSYTILANLEYKFKRKVLVAEAPDLIDVIVDKANNSDDTTANTMFRQIGAMVIEIAPLTDNNLYTYETISEGYGEDATETTTGYVKVGNPPEYDEEGNVTKLGTGIRGLKKKEFALLFPAMIDTDYVQYRPKKKWYSGLLTMLVIVVVIVAVVIAQQYWIAPELAAVAAGTAAVGTYAAIATFYAIALTVSTLVVSSLARAFAGRSSTLAYAFGDSVAFLSTASMIAGMISTILGIGAIINSIRETIGRQLQAEAMKAVTQEAIDDMAFEVVEDITTEMALDAFQEASMTEIISATIDLAVEAVQEVAVNAMDNVVSAFNGSLFTNMSTMELISGIGRGLNTAMQLFNMASPKADPSTPEPQTADEYVPDSIDAPELMFRYFECTEVFDPIATEDMCHNMLQGTIERKFDKYYNNTF